MLVKPNDLNFLVCIIFLLLCLSCNEESRLEDDRLLETSNGTSWISNLGLEKNTGDLSINNSGDYLVAGFDYILNIDANGNVVAEIQNPFPVAPSGLSRRSNIFNDKIYSFESIDFFSIDSEKKIELDIYNNKGNLIESMVLEATFIFVNAFIEEDKMTLITWNRNDPSTLDENTHIFQVDNNGQLLFSKNLNSILGTTNRIHDIKMLEDGNFLFEFNDTLYKVSNEFDLIATFPLSNRVYSFIEGPDRNIYIGGIMPNDFNYIIKLDANLNQVNEITFNNEIASPIKPSLTNYTVQDLAVHEGNLYALEVAFEYGQELRLQCFDLDFNKNNEFILEGSGPLSKLIVNELGSVSFLYGEPHAPFDEYPDLLIPTEARLFKLDVDCQLPEVTIDN